MNSFIPGNFTIPCCHGCSISSRVFSQHGCGACAAFAVATVASMHLCRMQGVDFVPSPWRLFDCANVTCESGAPLAMITSALKNGVGDVRQSSEAFGKGCKISAEKGIKTNSRLLRDGTHIMTAMLKGLDPLVGVITSHLLQDQDTGIYHRFLPLRDKRHALVIMGWGDSPTKHWIVKNSYGSDWGDGGGIGRIEYAAIEYAFDLFSTETDMDALYFQVAFVSLIVALVALILLWCFERKIPGAMEEDVCVIVLPF